MGRVCGLVYGGGCVDGAGMGLGLCGGLVVWAQWGSSRSLAWGVLVWVDVAVSWVFPASSFLNLLGCFVLWYWFLVLCVL